MGDELSGEELDARYREMGDLFSRSSRQFKKSNKAYTAHGQQLAAEVVRQLDRLGLPEFNHAEQVVTASHALALRVSGFGQVQTTVMTELAMASLAFQQGIGRLMLAGLPGQRPSEGQPLHAPAHDSVEATRQAMENLRRLLPDYDDLRRRAMVLGGVMILAFDESSTVLYSRLDALRFYLNAVSSDTETPGDDGDGEKADALIVMKEGFFATLQEVFVAIVPAAATGGFPVVGGLFAAVAAGKGIQERHKHAEERHALLEQIRLLREGRNTADDMWRLESDFKQEDEKLTHLVNELRDIVPLLMGGL